MCLQKLMVSLTGVKVPMWPTATPLDLHSFAHSESVCNVIFLRFLLGCSFPWLFPVILMTHLFLSGSFCSQTSFHEWMNENQWGWWHLKRKSMKVMQVPNLKCHQKVTNVLILIPWQSPHSGFERTIFSWFMICANVSL